MKRILTILLTFIFLEAAVSQGNDSQTKIQSSFDDSQKFRNSPRAILRQFSLYSKKLAELDAEFKDRQTDEVGAAFNACRDALLNIQDVAAKILQEQNQKSEPLPESTLEALKKLMAFEVPQALEANATKQASGDGNPDVADSDDGEKKDSD